MMDSSADINDPNDGTNNEPGALKGIIETMEFSHGTIKNTICDTRIDGNSPPSNGSALVENMNLDDIDFTMETDRKHYAARNHTQLDQYAVKSDGKSGQFESTELSETEFTSSRNHQTNDGADISNAMKFSNNHDPLFDRCLLNAKNSYQSVSCDDLPADDGYLRISELLDNLTSTISPSASLCCTMERSNSWEFCSFSGKRADFRVLSGSASSSLCSFTEFENVLRSFENNTVVFCAANQLSRKFFTFPRNRDNNSAVKRSCSDIGVWKGGPVTQYGDIEANINVSYCVADDVRLNGIDSDDESDDHYVARKKRRINSCAGGLPDSVGTNSRETNWNWPYVGDHGEPDDMENWWSKCGTRLPGQHAGKLAYDDDAGDSTTSETDVDLQRMRSWSVTLGRTKAANSSRQMERSYSIGVMASAIDSPKCCARCEPDDCVRPRSWMRASMRLVRPFHLADPPEPAGQRVNEPVQINLPPVFPCDVERPCSAPMPERPRQYGRSGQRRLSSRVSSVSSDSQGSSFGAENWDNVGEGIDSGSSRTQSETSPSRVSPVTRNESVSSNATQSTSRSVPAPSAGTYEMSQESESPLGQWSHGLSSMLACVGCTLGIFNISRFAIFSIHFGANFILQFLVLTVLIGIPLFTFHISLGQLLGTGVLNMWHISPIFKGIGVALLLSQAFIGIYSIIGVSWMFVYFRDSFISKQDVYRWAEPLELYGEDGVRTLKYNNGSYKIEQTVPDYFSGVVLQRRNVLKQEDDLMNVKFSVAFNLAIVWIIIFLSLSKGLKSYGKVVYVFSILPIFGMTLLCAKLLGFLPGTAKSRNFFPETDWSEFFLNSKSWVAAFTEVFLTWGVFGASAMQITSHNRQKHFLYRDSALVIVITVSVLLLSAFIANMCSQLLEYNNFLYLPSSFERSTTYLFLQRMDIPLPYSYATTPIRWMIHSGLILGERTIKPGTNVIQESGYQPLRLATELVPATFAAIGPKIISPFWSVLFYFIFIMFGISQQMAIWYGVISNIVAINVKTLKPCWTTITWFTCIGGFLLGLPMAMETGIFVVYFLDFVVGCGWWIMILYLLQLGAVFIVRGRPYSGETIVATLFTRSNYFLQNWIAPMFSFNWNVILPVTLLLLSTSVFKNGGYRMLYNWHSSKYYEYWPPWSRKCGCLMQILPLFTVPLVGIIQSYLYLTDGPLDLFERIQLLYRPVLENTSNLRSPNLTDTESNNRSSGTNNVNVPVNDDPPPKYTPPPSYSTATGARIAKLLRQSFRRSVIRIAHVLGTSDSTTASTSEDHPASQRQLPPPPDYSTVLVEINQSLRGANLSTINSINPSNITINENITHRSDDAGSTLTAQDVANILRSSLRRNRTLPVHNNLIEQECTSIQCLVESAAPINQDSIIMLDELKTQQQA